MSKEKLSYNQRLCMSIEEAAEYSMIGENRLRAIIENDRKSKRLDWIMHVGRCTRIKRPLFEKWVMQQDDL